MPMADSLQVEIPSGDILLEGEMVSPTSPAGLVIFAHGSGSSRHSSRNRFVAAELNRRGFSTLLFDLLTQQEDEFRATRFDIALLGRRLEAALEWTLAQPDLVGTRSACSARVPAPRRQSGWQRPVRKRSPPWSRAAVGPTWQAPRHLPASAPTPC